MTCYFPLETLHYIQIFKVFEKMSFRDSIKSKIVQELLDMFENPVSIFFFPFSVLKFICKEQTMQHLFYFFAK